MYRGNHTKAKAAHSKKPLTLLLTIIVVVALAAGGTIAYLQTTSGTITNIFKPSQVSCEVVDNGDGTYSVENTSDISAYLRAAVVCTWSNSEGIHWQNPSYTVSPGDGWFVGSDGFYYYEKAVAASAVTDTALQVSATGTAPTGYSFTVEILAEAIQSAPYDAVKDSWKVTVAADGTISK